MSHARDRSVYAKPGRADIPDELTDFLTTSGIETISLAGIDTDMCVLRSALDMFDFGD